MMNLKVDSRGRVRFSVHGNRFEVTKTGVITYERGTHRHPIGGHAHKYEMRSNLVLTYLSAETLRLLAEAILLVNCGTGVFEVVA